MRRLILMTMMLVAVLAFASVAQASSVNGLFIKDGISTNTADDASAEYISNGGTGTNDYKANRTVAVGDVVRGAFTISRINSTTTNLGLGAASGVNEWGGAFSIKVVSITDTATGTFAPGDAGAPALTASAWTIVFGADPNFDDWLNSISAGKGAGMVAGTAVRMWEDSTPDVDFQTVHTNANAEDADFHVATAMDGSFYWDLGFGTRGATWVATNSALVAPADTTGALAASPANFELTLMSSTGIAVPVKLGALIGPFGNMVDFGGNTSIFGAGVSTATSGGSLQNEEDAGFHARDKATIQFVALPVPQAVWLGFALMGLIGVGAARRRKAA